MPARFSRLSAAASPSAAPIRRCAPAPSPSSTAPADVLAFTRDERRRAAALPFQSRPLGGARRLARPVPCDCAFRPRIWRRAGGRRRCRPPACRRRLFRCSRLRRGGEEEMAELELTQVKEVLRRGRRHQGRRSRHQVGRVHRLRRAVGLRQVDLAAPHRRARGHLVGNARDRRQGGQRPAALASAASPWSSSPTRSIRT